MTRLHRCGCVRAARRQVDADMAQALEPWVRRGLVTVRQADGELCARARLRTSARGGLAPASTKPAALSVPGA
jgi:hypothetical protein